MIRAAGRTMMRPACRSAHSAMLGADAFIKR
jgi:hypothetical protein